MKSPAGQRSSSCQRSWAVGGLRTAHAYACHRSSLAAMVTPAALEEVEAAISLRHGQGGWARRMLRKAVEAVVSRGSSVLTGYCGSVCCRKSSHCCCWWAGSVTTSLEALGAWWHRKARLDARGGGRPPFRSCEGRQQSMPLAVHVSPTDWHCLCARCRIEVRVCSVSRNQGQTWERCPFQATELLGGVTQVTPATNMGVAANAVMLGSDGGFLMERQQRSRTAGMAGTAVISMSAKPMYEDRRRERAEWRFQQLRSLIFGSFGIATSVH